MELLRAFPEIVIAGFFLAILSLGPIPAIIAVAIHTIGALGKMFFEVVENVDMRAEEGLRASGGNWIERVWFAIVPQVMPNFLSYALLRFEINVRASRSSARSAAAASVNRCACRLAAATKPKHLPSSSCCFAPSLPSTSSRRICASASLATRRLPSAGVER